MASGQSALRGRGTAANPANRFEGRSYEPCEEGEPMLDARPATQVFTEVSKSILTRNDSPDVGFDTSINPYRGCEHGCIYCYARPTHEYVGLSAGLDFETKIFAKHDAPRLLRAELAKLGYRSRPIAMSGVTDPYQPIERELRLTRQCLDILTECRNPTLVITKNRLITRDLDLLGSLARCGAAAATISLTTLDLKLNRILEPRTSSPAQRLETISALREAGVPVGVLVAPIVPGLTDEEIPALLTAAREAGAQWAGYVLLRLPWAVAPLFEEWLEQHYPQRKDKILNRLKDLRGGRLYDSDFSQRMSGRGVYAQQLSQLFEVAARKAGFGERPRLSDEHFRRPGGQQLALF